MSFHRSFPLAVFALPLIAGLVAAPAWSSPGHHRRGFGLERKLEKLDLPAETRAAVQAVLDEAKPQREAFDQQMREARDAMKALLAQERVDEVAVMEHADALGELATERRKGELRTLIRVRGLLTAEQRAELDAMMQKWRGRHGRHGEVCEHGEAGPEVQPEA
jgi:Spy/CpxP family protein refolding chaperone